MEQKKKKLLFVQKQGGKLVSTENFFHQTDCEIHHFFCVVWIHCYLVSVEIWELGQVMKTPGATQEKGNIYIPGHPASLFFFNVQI